MSGLDKYYDSLMSRTGGDRTSSQTKKPDGGLNDYYNALMQRDVKSARAQHLDYVRSVRAHNLAMKDLMERHRAPKPYAGMSGEEIYATRKQEEQTAKNDFWSNAWKLIGNAAQTAQEAQSGAWVKPEDQITRSRENAAAATQMREASAQQKEAGKAIEWEGRQELLDKYKETIRKNPNLMSAEERKAVEEEARQIRAQLEAGDIAAGNGARSYTFDDRVRNVLSGSSKEYASGAVNTAGTMYDYYSDPTKAMDTFTPADIAQIRAYAGNADLLEQQAAQKQVNRQRADAMYATADRLGDEASAEIQKAKEGLGVLGQAGVDIAENVVQMGYDAAIGFATGLGGANAALREAGSLGAMFVRTFGSSAQEARKAGATLEQQITYGGVKGGIEVLTEKLFDGVAGIYGAGAADEVTKKVIGRLTESQTGRALLVVLSNAVEEGTEEVISDLLAPLAESIYNDQAMSGGYLKSLDPSEILYDFLIGAAIGGLGSVGGAATGQIRQDLVDMDVMQAGEYDNLSHLEQMLSSGEPVRQRSERAQARLAERGLNADGSPVTYQQRVSESLQERGYDEAEAQAAAELMTRQITGEDMSEQDRTKLQGEQVRMALRSMEQESETKLEISRDQEQTMMDGFEAERTAHPDLSPKMYAAAMREAYSAGKRGLTLTQAKRYSSFANDVLPLNYQHAFEMGAGQASSNAADVNTPDGRAELNSKLTMLGTHAQAAADVYEAGQDADAYAAAMDLAVGYAASGGDVAEYVQQAKDGGGVAAMLTDAQVAAAQEIGAQMQQERAQRTADLAAERAKISEQAEAILAAENPELGELNAAIKEYTDYQQTARAELKGLQEELEAMPEGEAREQAQERVDALERDIESAGEMLDRMKAEREQIRGKAARKKGTVSYDGGTIDGRRYAGIDRTKLSAAQQRVASMVEALADIINVDYVFFSGPAGMGGAYVRGGVVYINMNSGMGVRGFARQISAASLSHELTHFTQDYAPEEYAELRDFIVKEIMKKSPSEFDRLVKQQMRWEPGISYDGAVDELVANGCMTMLQNTQAVKQIVREHLNLAERFSERMHEIGEQIKAAFGEVDVNDNAAIYQAARFLQESHEEIQQRWDKAIAAATRNYNAEKYVEEKTGKKIAQDHGKAKYQKAEQEEILHLKDQVKAHMDEIMSLPLLASVKSGITFDENNIQEAVAWIAEQIGAPLKVNRKGFGDVNFTKKRINRGFNYLPGKKGDAFRNPVGQALTTACVAAPTIVENGKEIEHHKNHKGYGYPTWTFAGPVEIDGEPGVLTVVVKRTTDNFYDVHSIMTPDGDLLVLDKNTAEVSDGGASEKEDVAPPKLSAKTTIPQPAEESKSKNQTWENGEYADEYRALTEGKSMDELYDAMQQRGTELRTVREPLRERKPEFDRRLDESVKNGSGSLPERVEAFNRWYAESGYEALDNQQKKLDREYRMLRDAYDKANDAKLEADEKAAIEKSGLSEGEYFGKQAVKEFGYTPYFYDAGYILPSGKMLNFSGEKGKHYGSRGQDHRAIGMIFATTSQSEAMLRFMGYGNIRIMAESPGVDIASGMEPTAEQYRQMRSFIQSVRGEEYFNVDLTDERGNTVGNLEYDGTIRPDRIINDIKHFYQTGEVRDTGMSAFYQTWAQQDIDTVQNIGRKSVNDFNSSDIKAVEKLARQYYREMGNKSPFFRAWFGDWRMYDAAPAQIADQQGQQRGLQKNKDTGWNINVSGMVFNETSRHTASFNKAAQPYLPYINDIVRKAILLDTYGVGKAKSRNSLLMHSLYAVADIGNGPEVLKLYVEEMNDPNSDSSGKRAYQLQNIEKYQAPHGGSQKTASLRSALPGTGWSVSDLAQYVKSKDSSYQPKPVDPALLNPDGTPKVFYHGTAAEFRAFDMKKSDDKTGRLMGLGSGKGKIYLTEYEASARMAASGAAARKKGGAERVMPLYVQAEKVMARFEYQRILERNYEKFPNSRPGTASYDYKQRDKAIAATDKEVRAKGYDAVYDSDSGELFVYENTQVKSATENIGTFDRSNADTQMQRWDNDTDDTAREAQGREIAYARLQAENAALHDAVEGLKKLTGKQGTTIDRLEKQLRLTKEPSVRIEDAQKLARQLIKEYSSKADYVAVQKQLKELGDYILKTETSQLSEEEIKNRARAIAQELVENSATIDDYGGELQTYQEIAKSIRGKKMSIDKSFLGETDGFDAFRKANFGNFTLALREANSRENRPGYQTVDQAYIDLQGTYGEAYFPNVANEGEQIRVIADMFQRAKGEEINPFTQYEGEAVEYLANKIAMDAMDGIMRPTKPTAMDRQKARQETLKERVKALQQEGKLTEKEADRLRQTVYDLTMQLDRAESSYRSLQKGAETRLAQVQAEGKARALEIKAKERAKANEDVKALKEHYQDMAKRARQGRQNTASRTKIRKLINELNAKLAKPSENRYVPKELVQLTIDVLEMIDTDTGRSARVAEKLADIRAMYERYKQDPQYAVVYDEVTAQMLNNLETEIRGTKLSDMDERQLDMVYHTLKSLNHVISKAVNVKIAGEERNAFELSREMTQETREIPKAQTSWWKNNWLVSHLRADVMFNRFGGFRKNSTWSKVGQMLNDAQLKQTRLKMELSRPFAGLVNDRQGMEDFTGTNYFGRILQDKLVDIGLKDESGQPILVTHDLMVGIYLDLLNEENRRHFIRGGKTIPALQDFYSGRGGFGAGAKQAVGISEQLSELMHDLAEFKRANYGDMVEETQNKIDELLLQGEQYADSVKAKIEEQLTDFDRAWIEATQQLMDVDSKRELNATTMEVYGIEKARVENYFPITVDPDFLTASFDSVSRDMSLENAGFMKERVQSSKPTLAMGTFSVATRQIDRVAQYCGLMPALRSFGKILSKSDFGYQDSLKKALRSKFGEEAMKWMDGLISDLSGAGDTKRDDLGLSKLLGKLRGNLAQTSLTLNPRVALAQAASYPTAAAELGWEPLMKALVHGGKNGRVISRADQELIAKWSPLLWYRMQGYSTQELGDIKNNNSAMAKIWKKLRWATGWIQAVDGATVGRLWYAAEYWVQANRPSLEQGSDEYYEAVADKFNRVVERTQPNYTPMQRATVLRNPNELYKTLFMFMTQRLQNFNIVYDAAASYQKQRADYAARRNGVTREDVAEAKTQMVRALSSQLAQAAVYVGFKLLADALLHGMKKWRDDETGELTAESISAQLLNSYIDAIAGSFLLGSEVFTAIKAMAGYEKWYGLSVNGVDSVNDLVEDLVSLANTKDPKKRAGKIMNVAKSLAQFLGIPLNNGIKIGQAIIYTVEDIINGVPWQSSGYEQTTAQKKAAGLKEQGVSSRTYDKVKKAADEDGNGSLKQDELGPYLRDAIADGSLTETQAEAIWGAQGWKKTYAEWSEKNGGAKKAKAKDEIGQYGAGNIDLYDRNTKLYDEDGNLMTVKSFSFGEDGQEILVPSIVKKNGKWVELTEDQAIDWYHKTGEYLGKFDTVAEANAYAQKLHEQQTDLYL